MFWNNTRYQEYTIDIHILLLFCHLMYSTLESLQGIIQDLRVGKVDC